jgi:polyhydroxyalkanoate synthase
LADRYLARAATTVSRRRGYLDGKALAEVFAWLRPGDLVWQYWVNNYLLGRKPPAFDVLYWNADTTRMPARLHADLVDVALHNRLAGRADLKKVDVDAYVVAGIADHITPWQSCYRTTGILGGDTRFVLSTSGHIAAVIHPPGNPKSAYRVGDESLPDPDEWLASTDVAPGTWWEDWDRWLADRSGGQKPAPRRLGNRAFPASDPAPGTYVFDRSKG